MSQSDFSRQATLGLALVGLLTGCAPSYRTPSVDSIAALREAKSAVRATELRRHVERLASDAYEGRGPGSRGEDSTVDYLARELARHGLRPGNQGSFFQAVPLIGRRIRATGSYETGGRRAELRSPEDFGLFSMWPDGAVDRSPVVFAGYGVVAPEYGWDAYRDLDIRGKTVVLLWGDPAARSASDSASVRALVDKWKAEGTTSSSARRIAAFARGASSVVYVHDDRAIGSTYTGLIPYFVSESLSPADTPSDTGRSVSVMARLDVISDLLRAGNRNLDDLKRAALDPGFRAVPLDVRISLRVNSESRRFVSRNVVARLDGTDSALSSQYVLYTAHWDHLGRLDVPGDQIYNGAVDNAGGTAQLLAIAEAFARVRVGPKRSLLFIATTAEEAGLLGASHYVAHPIVPLARTVAVINLDWFFPWGRTRDVINIGHGNSTLDDVLEQAARAQGRRVTPDPWPEQEYFRRSDHFPFAAVGIPALFAGAGMDYVDRPSGWGMRMIEEFLAKHLHQPSDEPRPDWDYSGAADDAQLLFDVGFRISRNPGRPQWKATTSYPAFKAAHEAMLRRPGAPR